jgi:cytoskeletal protein CcmA (bactofilin family)
MKWLLASVFIVFALLLPATASADDGKEDNGLTLRITGDVTIARDQTVGAVVVIDGTATIDGTVTNSLVVINGTAIINGTVQDDVTVISGTLDLRSGAHVEGLHLFDSQLIRADGVIVSGAIEQSDGIEVPAGFLAALSIYFWVAMTLTLVVAGLAFAAIGGRQLNEASRLFTGEPTNTLIGAVSFWVIAPLLAVAAILTLVGIPLGLGMLVIVLPAAWFLGYIVAGAWLGKLILHRGDDTGRPFAAVTLGIVLLQLSVIVPIVGGLVALLAGVWGAGTLAYMAYRAAGGKGFSSSNGTPVITANPSPAV